MFWLKVLSVQNDIVATFGHLYEKMNGPKLVCADREDSKVVHET